MMHERCLPPGANPSLIPNGAKHVNNIAGLMNISRKAYLQEISLPEFDKSRKIDGADVYVFNSDCQHDIIIGRDILQKIGFIINFAENKMVWLDQEVQIKPAYYWENPMSSHIVLDADNGFESYAARILDAKYEQMKLKSVLDNYGTLFDDPLGHYKNYKVHLKVDPNAQPVHAKPYPIPHVHRPTFKKELDHLCGIGVLRRTKTYAMGVAHIHNT